MEAQRPTIILAESQSPLRQALARMLKDLGSYQVIETSDGSQAWQLLRGKPASCVIAGWNMPEMSGLALLKVLRADASLAAVPLMLVTFEITKVQVIEAGEAGVSDIMLVPVTPLVFKRKVEGLLRADQDPQALEAERHYQLGLDLMNRKRFEEALLSFQKVISIQQNPEVYYNMGYIKTAQGRWEEAIQYFRRATQINNSFAKAFQRMGECYLELKRPRLAEQSFQKAADIYIEKRMDDSAELVLKEVLKINPNTINVFNSLGIIYRRQGKFDKALEQYKKALKVNPRDENIYYNMGRIYYEQGGLVDARQILVEAVQINPGFNEAVEMLKAINLRLSNDIDGS